ncbi:S8/S53 family peptidase [Pseudoclavibacter sp. CFCC 13796]|uniref:S8/S53 family peptidase n=1 Tax=Pseudoclavibacter sp. CFCC 13796 TaxID=2615179 RepID=UPI0017888F18|nr:S8/S53 family peptidase [Pseudoclavibacter sp. CFCC 13796]
MSADGVRARHATSVVSIVSALAPDATIDVHPVGTADLHGRISCESDRSAAMARAFSDAGGAQVILVTSTVARSPELDREVRDAVARGAFVIVARPESAVVDRSSLLAIDGVIGVQAVDATGDVPEGHFAEDPEIDVVAQGVDMPMFGVLWGRVTGSGTSLAAPVVAGCVAAAGADPLSFGWLSEQIVVTPQSTLRHAPLRAQVPPDAQTRRTE